MSRLRAGQGAPGSETGVTLVELLVAMAMGIVLLGAVGAMVMSAMRSQPEASERAQNISSARWVLERFTREIRNGLAVDKATSSTVSFRTFVRRTTCGASGVPATTTPAIECQVTYACTTTACTRAEANPGEIEGGTARTVFGGIDDANVFSYSPSAEDPSYIEVTLSIPNPSGGSGLTVSDGASLRNATLEF
jgi:type II secretory pathway pseudopilin PulG